MSRITTPFTATSTAAEVVEGIDLSGRTVAAERLWDVSLDLLAAARQPH